MARRNVASAVFLDEANRLQEFARTLGAMRAQGSESGLLETTGSPLDFLTKAAEDYDDASFASLAQALNYSSHHINMAHLDALVWADSITL